MNLSGRYDVNFAGHVQGVGFRYTAQRIAAGFQVVGFVQNLADGTVRLVAEGELAEMDALLAAIREQMADFIGNVRMDRQSPSGEFQGFEIRR